MQQGETSALAAFMVVMLSMCISDSRTCGKQHIGNTPYCLHTKRILLGDANASADAYVPWMKLSI